LASAEVKLRRALSYLDELRSSAKDYFQRDPFKVEKSEDETGDLVYGLRIFEEVPLELAAIAGDLLHNARAVLDHLIWTSVEENGNTPTRQTAFPISSTEQAFNQNLPRCLNGASHSAHRLVQLLRPYLRWQ
jgi:hypothetical protein